MGREEKLTAMLKTMGIADEALNKAGAETMRTDISLQRAVSEDLVKRLPRLLETGEEQTAPELKTLATLGEGGMGIVKLAEQLSVGREVAVKRVRPGADSENATMALLREGWTTGRLEHPNIVPIYSLGRSGDGELVIVMKRIAGTSWIEIITEPEKGSKVYGGEPPREFHIQVLMQVCNAVHYAHSRGVIHRDIKPENVMLGEFGEVYLLDWGIAVALEEDPSGRLASVQDVDKPEGTVVYMAPEMVEGGGGLGVHTDIFLLGATLYEVLTGRPPFSGATIYQVMLNAHRCDPPQFDDTVPAELAAICRRAMAREPADRYESTGELREALSTYRRNRESRRYAAQGKRRLDEFLRYLRDIRGSGAAEKGRLYKAFGECRFAFEQSLEIDGENEEASAGLQEALEEMAVWELGQGAHRSAYLLIADLPEPNPALQESLVELEEELASRKKDHQALQAIRHEVDINRGRRPRTVFIIVMGALIGLTIVATNWLAATEVIVRSYPLSMVKLTGLSAVLGAALFFWRRHLAASAVNLRMMRAVVVLVSCAVVHRGIAWASEMPLDSALAMELNIYVLGACMLAIAYDWRILYAGAAFLAAAAAGVLWPGGVFWTLPFAIVLSVGVLVWIWRPTPQSEAVEKGEALGE